MKLFLTSSPIGIYRSEEPLDCAEIRGEAYMIRDGSIRQICANGERYLL